MTVALDFGTSNTVIARRDDATGVVEVLAPPELSRPFEYALPGDSQPRTVAVIPSLIHYGAESLLGAQVEQAGLVQDPGTFRWLKLDMLRRNQLSRRLGERRITYAEAAAELVSRVLLFTAGGGDLRDEELVLTVPVECYDHYPEWLGAAARRVFRRGVHFVDEATACVLGYQPRLAIGEVFLIVDFGGGTLDVSAVRTALTPANAPCCRILGRAGEEVGGMMLDQWLANALEPTAAELQAVGPALLLAAEAAKIQLTYEETAAVAVHCPLTGRLLRGTFTRAQFQALLAQQGLPGLIARTIARALEAAQERTGLRPAEIGAVLVVGGTGLIPAVREQLEALFPGKVRYANPFTAIATGACRSRQHELSPTLVHDYCLKSWDRDTRSWVFTVVLPRGTAYPTAPPVKTLFLNAAHEGQDRLGLLFYEVSAMARRETDFVVGPDGRLLLADSSARQVASQQPLNPGAGDFVLAEPPCRRGERRFAVGFGVDAAKRLTVSLRDCREDGRSWLLTADGRRLPLPVVDYPALRLGG